MATKYKPFLFERRFDEFEDAGGGRARPANSDGADWSETTSEGAAVEPEEDAPPPAPTFSEDELAAAKTAAYDEGRRDGLEAGRAEVQQEVDAHIADLLETAVERIAPLAERQKQAHEHASAMMAKIARDMFERLMPAYVQRYGDEEVLGLVADSLANLQDVGRLTVRVAPEAVEPLTERLEETVRLAGFEGKLSVLPDPAMARGDAALDWGAGGAERRYKDIWREIDEAVTRAIDALPPEDGDAEPAEPAEPAADAQEGPEDAPQTASPEPQEADADEKDGDEKDGGATDAEPTEPQAELTETQADAAPAEKAPEKSPPPDQTPDETAKGPADAAPPSEASDQTADETHEEPTSHDTPSGAAPDDQR